MTEFPDSLNSQVLLFSEKLFPIHRAILNDTMYQKNTNDYWFRVNMMETLNVVGSARKSHSVW